LDNKVIDKFSLTPSIVKTIHYVQYVEARHERRKMCLGNCYW